jgi:hypothetical protein
MKAKIISGKLPSKDSMYNLVSYNYACMYACMYSCIHVCMYVCIFVYVNIQHIHIYSYLYTHIPIGNFTRADLFEYGGANSQKVLYNDFV